MSEKFLKRSILEFIEGDNMEWQKYANCRDMSPEQADNYFFFPSKGKDPYKQQRESLCGACPVQKQCLLFGNELSLEDGAWGGVPVAQRRAMVRNKGKEIRPVQLAAER